MTFIKNCFQSEILRTVNSTSSFIFANLAKNYGCYILRTVYNSYFRHDDSPGESCDQSVAAPIDFVAFQHKIRHYAKLAIFFTVFCTMFSVKAQTVPLCLGDSQTSL